MFVTIINQISNNKLYNFGNGIRKLSVYTKYCVENGNECFLKLYLTYNYWSLTVDNAVVL